MPPVALLRNRPMRRHAMHSQARASLDWPSLLLWSAAITVGGFGLVTQRWSETARFVIAAMLLVAVAGLVNRLRLRGRVPAWLNHADAIAGTVLISTAIHFDGRDIGEFSVLYLLIGLFVAFFMRIQAAAGYGCLISAAYGVVLLLGPSAPNELGHWVALVVVLAVVETLVVGLTEQLRQLASCDPLTGLPNRRAWDVQLDLELERATRVAGQCSVAMLDLNGFKDVNDRDGHDAGDRILVAIADHWRAIDAPRGAFFARLGGDEFGLLVTGATTLEVEAVLQRLATSLAASVTFSAGTVTWDGSETAGDVTRRADHRMYTAKQASGPAPLGPPHLSGPRGPNRHATAPAGLPSSTRRGSGREPDAGGAIHGQGSARAASAVNA